MRYKDTRAIRRVLLAEKWSEARSLILGQLHQFPGEPWLLANLAYTHYMEGRSREAKRLLAQAYCRAPRDPFVLWEYASLLANLGSCEQALRLLKQILRLGINPSSWIETGTGKRRTDAFLNDCRFRAGICNFCLNRPASAVRYLEKYIDHRNQGIASLYTKNEATEKIETLRNLELIRSSATTKENSARLQHIIKKELKKTPDNHWLHVRLAETYYAQGRYRQALQHADEALRMKSDDGWTMWACASCLEMLDRNEEAMKLYKRILRRGLDRIAAGGGKRWARMLLNDCRCAVGMCYWVMLKEGLAVRWLKEHLRQRHRDDESVYSLQAIKTIVADSTGELKGSGTFLEDRQRKSFPAQGLREVISDRRYD